MRAKIFGWGIDIINGYLQQYEVIRDHTEFGVAEYYGSKGIGEWSAECWKKEVGIKDVILLALYVR